MKKICALLLLLTAVFIIYSCKIAPEDYARTSEAASGPAVALIDSLVTNFIHREQNDEYDVILERFSEIRSEYSGDSLIIAYSYLYEGFINETVSDHATAFDNLMQAYDTARRLGSREIMIRAAPRLINAAFVTSREIDQERIVEEVIALANEPPADEFLRHMARQAKGIFDYNREDFTSALEALIPAAEFFEREGHYVVFRNVNNTIALALQRTGRPEQALQRHEHSLRYYYSTGNLTAISRTLNNVSISLRLMEEVERAVDSLKVALAINEQLGLAFNVLQVQYNLGTNLRDLGNYDESERYLRESLRSSERLGIPMGVMFNSLGLASTLIARDSSRVNLDEVRTLLQQTKDSAPNLSDSDLYTDFSMAMFQLEQIAGNFEEALRWHIIYQQEYSKMKSTERQVAIEELMFANRLERSEAEIAHLSEVIELKERAQRNLYAALGVLGLLLLGAGGSGSYFRRLGNRISILYNVQKRQNAEIARQNEELKRLSDERLRLTKVIIHDLRNPIGAIAATLELLEDHRSEELDQCKMFIQRSVNKMSLIVNGLLKVYQAESLEIRDKLRETDIKPLLDLQVQEFSILAAHKQQKLIAEIDPVSAITHGESLNMIVSNLLSNAIKYTPHNKNITIRVRNVPDGWELTIQDQGPGFRESDKEKMFTLFGRLSGRPTGDEETTGIGLYAAKTAADKLGAKLTVNWDYTSGAEISCFFPQLKITGQQV